ncbi:MAG: hypothetical protein H6923_00100 [Alphaproteobacteria bacterium]|nr:hypothetical protein [Alphaproteobacteria bacterium]
MSANRQKLPQPEELLLDYAERLAYHRAGRLALWFHLSKLRAAPRADARQHLLADLFKSLVAGHQGQTYALRCGDLVIVLREPRRGEIDELVYKARYLFREDPLVVAEEEDGTQRFCERFEMEADYERFRDAVRERARHPVAEDAPVHFSGHLARHLEAISAEARKEGHPSEPDKAPAGGGGARPADTRLLRELPAMRLGAAGGEAEALVLVELELDPARAREELFRGIDAASNPALGSFIATRLEASLLDLATSRMPVLGAPAALRLSLDGVLSADFLRFDHAWRALKSVNGDPVPSPVIVLSRGELADQPDAFRFAREFLDSQGYRIALGGVPIAGLPGVDAAALGIGLVIAEWRASDFADLLGSKLSLYRATVERLGAERIVLGGVAEARALKLAQALGIRVFSGPHIAAGGHRQAALSA